MDLGTLLGYWSDPDDLEEMRARPYGPTFLPGSLSRTGLVRRYEERTGRAVGAALFYYVFALFKIAVIVQQIYKRYVEGHTHDPRFAALMGWVRVVASQAARAMERAGRRAPHPGHYPGRDPQHQHHHQGHRSEESPTHGPGC